MMKKKGVVAIGVLALLVLGALCEIQIAYEDDRMIAWRVLLPWSDQQMDRHPTFEWVPPASAGKGGRSVYDARCYGLAHKMREWILD